MLHPSYSDLMKVVNSEVEPGEAPVVNSRYSIVMATSKRARQIIGGEEALVNAAGKKPLSVAVEELNQGKIRILSEEEVQEELEKKTTEEAEGTEEAEETVSYMTEETNQELPEEEAEEDEAVSQTV
ncbi:MAG: DNA-directed RNA polymerase subunit omega [Lachnospiraceae bacterium]|nr:DNA-directed RNA polymerase subunit omega [Lachnospiraceae bacterium]